jgi:hypothetical protein
MIMVGKRTPELGDVVHVPAEALQPVGNNGADVAVGIISRVWSDDKVNVRVLLDGTERVLSKTSMPLHADRGEWAQARAEGGAYGCYWPEAVPAVRSRGAKS